MAYSIKFAEIVVKEQIPVIPMPYRKQIKRAIEERLAIDPIKLGKPLKYSLFGLRRLRVGDWRIIYRIKVFNLFCSSSLGQAEASFRAALARPPINEYEVEIIKIGNRKEVYEN